MSDEVATRSEPTADDDPLFDERSLDSHAGQTGYLLPYAVVASLFVLGAPLLVTVAAVLAVPSLHPSVLVGLAVATAVVAVMSGIMLWNRRPESVIVSFDELLPWHAVARHRAERRLSAVSELLGFGSPHEARAAAPPSLTTLYQIVAALEAKDPYTHRHSGRVERHVRRTAIEIGLPPEEVEQACRAAALHDVGKIEVPDEILRKPEALTTAEWNVIAQHPDVGARLVAGAVTDEVAAGVRHHHERWDGRGYPDGLWGETIPLYARLVAVADTFDALTSARPYRPGLGAREASAIVAEEAGRQLDPNVVQAFLDTLSRRRPIALAFLPLMWRRATLPVRAAGSSVVASSVATVAILGSGIVPMGEPAPRSVARDPAGISSTEVQGVPFVLPSTTEPNGEKKPRRRRAREGVGPPRIRNDRPATSTDQGRAVGAPAKDEGAGTAPGAGASASGAAFTPSGPLSEEPQPSARPPEEKPPPQSSAPEDKPPPDRPHRDPQPDKGKDCPGNGNGGGKGNSTHCG